MRLDIAIKKIPLVLPDIIIDGESVKDWEFIVLTFNLEGKEPYLVYRYQDPHDDKKYIFMSRYTIYDLVEYLKEYKLIKINS